MTYTILDCEAHPYNRILGYPPVVPDNWMGGERFTLVAELPLVFELDPECPGVMRELYVSRIPLVRDDLLAALREAGVDNLDAYPAVIRDPATGVVHTGYHAVNIVGAIACLDLSRSGTVEGLEGLAWDGLSIDPARAGGARLFRPAGSENAIVIHDDVRQFLVARGFANLTFTDPADWCG